MEYRVQIILKKHAPHNDITLRNEVLPEWKRDLVGIHQKSSSSENALCEVSVSAVGVLEWLMLAFE